MAGIRGHKMSRGGCYEGWQVRLSWWSSFQVVNFGWSKFPSYRVFMLVFVSSGEVDSFLEMLVKVAGSRRSGGRSAQWGWVTDENFGVQALGDSKMIPCNPCCDSKLGVNLLEVNWGWSRGLLSVEANLGFVFFFKIWETLNVWIKLR
jgi:hypothetical protein